MGQERSGVGYEVRVEHDVPATMRDGTVLRADVAWPVVGSGGHGGAEGPSAQGQGPLTFPVLLMRTPYKKRAFVELARAGYIAVSQDVRGRYASEGAYEPVCQPCGALIDRQDGYDTVMWAAGLPGSDGRVGVFGVSYPAWEAWELAISRPAPLVALYVSGMAVRSNDVEPLPRPGRRIQWFHSTGAPDTRRRLGLPGPHTPAEAGRIWEVERHRWLWFLPWSELPERVLGPMAPYLRRSFQHSTEDQFRFAGQHHEIDVPVFHRTGWYDRWVATIDHFTAMRAEGRSERARQGQRLMVGPWGHTGTPTRVVGDVDFGAAAEADETALMLRWFDYWLKGRDTGVLDDPPVRYFVMGRNEWRGADTWPPAGTRPQQWYLRSGGGANSAAGDGWLSLDAPAGGQADPSDSSGAQAEAGADHYSYDPVDPVPTVWPLNDQAVPLDHRALDHRTDLLVYVSRPLAAALELAGELEVTLWAASSAPDTDFVARLADVWPDGFVQPLCTGIVRARYRDGYDQPPRLLEPGAVERYAIRLGPVAHCFLPGHRLRMEVTSSDFPNYDRNHNIGGDDFSDPRLAVARQTVLHTAGQPSHVTLPLSPVP